MLWQYHQRSSANLDASCLRRSGVQRGEKTSCTQVRVAVGLSGPGPGTLWPQLAPLRARLRDSCKSRTRPLVPGLRSCRDMRSENRSPVFSALHPS
eukprot:6458316-Amphidinium_carterae.1